MSTFERGTSPTLSMREKSLLKRRINREHNSNFRAGYVNINEEQLHKTGIRGRKRYIIYIVTLLLALTVLINILITGTILAVLSIGREGMAYLEFIPHGLLIRFLRNSDMGNILLMETEFGSLPEQPLELSASAGGQVQLQVFTNRGAILTLRNNETVLQSLDGVEILDPDTGETVFSTNQQYTKFPEVARTIDSAQLVTDRVTSDTKDRLSIQSEKQAILAGYNGVSLGGRTISMKGRNLSFFTAEDLIVNGTEGTRLLFYKGLPVKDESAPVQLDTETFKLCVHHDSGELFSVPWHSSCLGTV